MKKLAFFDQKHGLTPLRKCDFSDFKKIFFHSQKKVSFLSRSLFILISSYILSIKKTMKKLAFFDQKHKLTPLEKCKILEL